jgi:hypothetical protein
MLFTGTAFLRDIAEKNGGSSLSLPIASSDREADIMPALAVVINAVIAAAANRTLPQPPMNRTAADDMGVSEPESFSASITPTVTAVTAKYRKETISHAVSIPSGIFRPGLCISSDTAATLVKPP